MSEKQVGTKSKTGSKPTGKEAAKVETPATTPVAVKEKEAPKTATVAEGTKGKDMVKQLQKENKELQALFDKFKKEAEEKAAAQERIFGAYPVRIVKFKSLGVHFNENRRGGKKTVETLNNEPFMQSIEDLGLIEPLLVQATDETGKKLNVKNGFRRSYGIIALTTLGRKVKQPKGYEEEEDLYVPVRVLPHDLPLDQLIALEMGANMQEPWGGVALVEAALELRKAGHTNAEIAKALSINETQVGGYIQVAENPAAMRKLKSEYATENYRTLPISITALVNIVKGVNATTEGDADREKRTEEILGKANEAAAAKGDAKITKETANTVLEGEGAKGTTNKPAKTPATAPAPKEAPKKFDAQAYLMLIYNIMMDLHKGTPYAESIEAAYDAMTEAVATGKNAEEAAETFKKSIGQSIEWSAAEAAKAKGDEM
jgi:hypothetical protein